MEEQFLRQADIIPRDRLCDYTITVIGTGAIGRQVALQLTAIGASKIQLIDFDTVGSQLGNARVFRQRYIKTQG